MIKDQHLEFCGVRRQKQMKKHAVPLRSWHLKLSDGYKSAMCLLLEIKRQEFSYSNYFCFY